jgi:fatty-acyl-CoA synthase
MTRRVMNLAHIATQNARRLAEHPAFIWGEKTLDWAEIDAQVSARWRQAQARGIGKGDRLLVHSKNCDAMFVSMFATFGSAPSGGACFRLLRTGRYLAAASGAKGFSAMAIFRSMRPPSRPRARAGFIWRIGGGLRRGRGRRRHRPPSRREGREQRSSMTIPAGSSSTSGTTRRSKAAVLTHGQMGFVITNHLCDLVPGSTEADASLVVAPLSHGAGVRSS